MTEAELLNRRIVLQAEREQLERDVASLNAHDRPANEPAIFVDLTSIDEQLAAIDRKLGR